jgi:ubiquinone/menaquinone biosynthesis C-methylase UbiE
MTSSIISPDPTVHGLIFGATATKVVTVAAELGLADLLADGARSAQDLARDTSSHRDAMFRLLRTLAGLGLVTQTEPDRFALTGLGSTLRTESPDSVHAVITMLWGSASWASWGEIVTSVRTGEPAWLAAHGQSWVEFYDSHPDASAEFNKAMSQHTRDAAPALIEAAHICRSQTVVDVGGGDGTLLAEILQACPDAHGILFDLPSGLATATVTLERSGVAERCRIESGDFFTDVPDGADAYLLKQILHDWPDEAAVDILRSCRRAMSPESRLLVLERVLPEIAGPEHTPTLLLDMHMLVVTGGRERTEREFRDLLAAAGFTTVGVRGPLPPFDYHVIEAAPET